MTDSADNRLLRVFVSSTFRDMQRERDLLATRAFPELDRICRERGLQWREIDLRWGVTREQAERGEVLEICLSEVENCQPWFICLLGERYGYVPERVERDLIERWPWLEAFAAASVTELEIRHAILGAPDARSRALFYFRDPAYVDRLPPETDRADFVEPDPNGARRLRELKQSIAAQALHCHNYSDPDELAELVVAHMLAIIDERFPANAFDPTTAEEQAQARHRTMLIAAGRSSRVDVPTFLGRIRGRSGGFMLDGAEGSGKSLLMAQIAAELDQPPPPEAPAGWLRRLTGKPSTPAARELRLVHFADASERSGDWRVFAGRLIALVNRTYGTQIENADDARALTRQLAEAMDTVSPDDRLIILFDGLDLIDNGDRAQNLGWLPVALPPNILFLGSANLGIARDAMVRRAWTSLHIAPLDPESIGASVRAMLGEYGKSLAPDLIARIMSAPAAANPLHLRLIVQELRLHGEHETLEGKVDRLCAAPDIESLLDQVLARCEEDFDGDRPSLVRDACQLIGLSRFGITESELLAILSGGAQPLPQAYWSPLRLSLDASLQTSTGVLRFSHAAMEQAVGARYGDDDVRISMLRMQLADAMAARADGDVRALREAAHQYRALRDWRGLRRLLFRPEQIVAFGHADFAELAAIVQSLCNEGGYPLTLLFDAPLADVEHADKELLNYAANLLMLGGEPTLALAPMEELLRRARAASDGAGIMVVLERLSAIHEAEGNDAASWRLLKEMELIARGSGDDRALAACLHNQFCIALLHGHRGQALELIGEADRLAEATRDHNLLGVIAGNRGELMLQGGDPRAALALFMRHEEACRRTKDDFQLITALERQASAYARLGENAIAIERLTSAIDHAAMLGRDDMVADLSQRWAHLLRR